MCRRRELWISAVLSCLVAAGCTRTKANQAPPSTPKVIYTTPTTDEVTDYEEFIGHTDAVFTVEVRARVTGYLDKVNFNDGDEVEKGALLFQIDDRPYKAEYDRTVATLEQGKARLTRLTLDYHRAETLMARNAIGKEEYDRIHGDYEEGKATVGVYTAALDRAKLDLDFTKVTAPIGGRLSRRMVDPGNLVKADETALTTIVSLDPMYVYFDIDERTILRIRRMIAAGVLKSRADGAVIPVLVSVADEKDAEGNYAFPHKGRINFSDNKVDSGTGTLRVRGVIDNPKPRLLSPGLFVRIRLPVGQPQKQILIDEQAIGSSQSNKFVYVVRKAMVKQKDPKTGKPIEDPKTGKPKEVLGDVAFEQMLKVGTLSNGKRVVIDGLKGDEKVIISGIQRFKTGDEVEPITPEQQERLRLKSEADAIRRPAVAADHPAPPAGAAPSK